MEMKIIRISLIARLFVVCFSFSLQSAQVTIPVTKTATLDSSDKDSGCLLFKFDLPEGLNGAFIDYAELLFQVEPEPSTSRRVVLGGFPLTKEWNEDNLSWTDIGSAYIDTLMATCLSSKQQDGLTSLDITEIARLWAEGKTSNFGLILRDLDRRDGKLKLEQSSHFSEGMKAEVRIFYTASQIKK